MAETGLENKHFKTLPLILFLSILYGDLQYSILIRSVFRVMRSSKSPPVFLCELEQLFLCCRKCQGTHIYMFFKKFSSIPFLLSGQASYNFVPFSLCVRILCISLKFYIIRFSGKHGRDNRTAHIFNLYCP